MIRKDLHSFAMKNIYIRFARSDAIDIERDYRTLRCEGMGARVHLFIQSDRRPVGRSPRAKGTRDIESRFGAALSPRRHIWAVFFGTGCPIWYRREPLCERSSSYGVSKPNGCDSFFILSVQVAILYELVGRQENIALHGRAIRFFCPLPDPRGLVEESAVFRTRPSLHTVIIIANG